MKNEIYITMENINEYDETKHYTIVADYEIYGKIETCLVRPCADIDKYVRMMTNPTEEDINNLKGGVNPRLHEVNPAKCWWNEYGTN